MKHVVIAIVLTWAALLTGCGSNSNSENVNGNWTANLTDSSGTTALSFTTSLTTNSDGTVTGTNLNFTTASPCFDSSATQTGGFSVSGTTNGVTTGAFTLTIQSGTTTVNGTNTLNLQGTLNNNTVTGTWVLTGTGSGCTGSGNFTMTKS
jgi:hypothetical protein